MALRIQTPTGSASDASPAPVGPFTNPGNAMDGNSATFASCNAASNSPKGELYYFTSGAPASGQRYVAVQLDWELAVTNSVGALGGHCEIYFYKCTSPTDVGIGIGTIVLPNDTSIVRETRFVMFPATTLIPYATSPFYVKMIIQPFAPPSGGSIENAALKLYEFKHVSLDQPTGLIVEG